MRNLAPGIFRQRLLLEGFYKIKTDKLTVKRYFATIANALKLRTYGKPTIFSPGGIGKKVNQGYDCFVPLIDSGISAYFWTNAKFFSIVIYTCKGFNEKKATATTKKFFKAGKIECLAF